MHRARGLVLFDTIGLNDVELLHDDRDFLAFAAVDRRLRLVLATGS